MVNSAIAKLLMLANRPYCVS